MVATVNAQSVAEFQAQVVETFDRITRTGRAEMLTVDGEVKAVLLSPAAYDDLVGEQQLRLDVDMLREGIRQADAGQSVEAATFFDKLRADRHARQAAGVGQAEAEAEE